MTGPTMCGIRPSARSSRRRAVSLGGRDLRLCSPRRCGRRARARRVSRPTTPRARLLPAGLAATRNVTFDIGLLLTVVASRRSFGRPSPPLTLRPYTPAAPGRDARLRHRRHGV